MKNNTTLRYLLISLILNERNSVTPPSYDVLDDIMKRTPNHVRKLWKELPTVTTVITDATDATVTTVTTEAGAKDTVRTPTLGGDNRRKRKGYR